MNINKEQRTLGLLPCKLIREFSKPYKWWLEHSTPSAQAMINGSRLILRDNLYPIPIPAKRMLFLLRRWKHAERRRKLRDKLEHSTPSAQAMINGLRLILMYNFTPVLIPIPAKRMLFLLRRWKSAERRRERTRRLARLRYRRRELIEELALLRVGGQSDADAKQSEAELNSQLQDLRLWPSPVSRRVLNDLRENISKAYS